MMIRTIFAAAAFVALAACASTPPRYAPAATQGGVGYSATQIESDRYTVTYRASGSANAQLISDYALLRAADITLESGHEWFWVVRRNLEGEDTQRSGLSIGVGVGAGSHGRHGGVSVGVGTSVPVGGTVTGVARAVTLEIRFGSGPKPDDVNAYDARAVAANLRSRTVR